MGLGIAAARSMKIVPGVSVAKNLVPVDPGATGKALAKKDDTSGDTAALQLSVKRTDVSGCCWVRW